jgi:1-acyl-sn-glycerol-3-phosphate acyltransferase
VAVIVAGVVASSAVARLRAPARDRLVRAWARAVARSLGVRIRIWGEIPPSADRHRANPQAGELLVANHVSWLDTAVVAAVRPSRMVAKDEVRRWPLLGRLVARGGTLFVARDRPRVLPSDVATVARALRGGSTVAVFPEGSTWCGERHGRFRNAMFQAALDAGAPVRPVALAYRGPDGGIARAAAFVGEDTLVASVWRVAGARGLCVEARVLPWIVPQPGPPPHHASRARRDLAAAAHTAISDALRMTSRRTPI